MTTVRNGDLSAVEPVGRLLTTAAVVIGHVFLVTFVAMIVGPMVGRRTGSLIGWSVSKC